MNSEQSECWNSFYKTQNRPWRGVANLPELNISEKSKVLELGCGNGKTSEYLMQLGYSVTATDFSEEAVSACEKRFGNKMEYAVCRSDDLPFDNETFDCVVLVHILEHLDDSENGKTADEIFRVLRPGGKVFIKSFSNKDMRASENMAVKGNGIRYRYYAVGEIPQIYKQFKMVYEKVSEEQTRFGTTRSRIECMFERV